MIPKEQEKTLSGSSLRAQQVKDLTLTVLWHWFDPRPKNIHVPWAQAKTNEENTLVIFPDRTLLRTTTHFHKIVVHIYVSLSRLSLHISVCKD